MKDYRLIPCLELAKDYKELAEEIENTPEIELFKIVTKRLGFNTSQCSICKSVDFNCVKCIYTEYNNKKGIQKSWKIKHNRCCIWSDESFFNLERANYRKDRQELIECLNARAEFILKVIRFFSKKSNN